MNPTKLEILLDHHVRMAGHTTASIKVAAECGGLLVVTNPNQARDIHREHACLQANQIIPLTDIDDRNLAGVRRPMVIDHYALSMMMHEATTELRAVRRQLSEARATLVQISRVGYRVARRGKKLTRADKERNHLVQLAKQLLAQP